MKVFLRALRVLWWVCLGLSGPSGLGQSIGTSRLIEGRHFEVLSDSMADGRAFLVEADRIGEVLARLLGPSEGNWISESGFRLLPVQIRLVEQHDAEHPSVVWAENGRQLLVFTERSAAQRALAYPESLVRAWLGRHVIGQEGPASLVRIPDWMIWGLTRVVMHRQNLSLPVAWRLELGALDRPYLQDVTRPEAEGGRAEGYSLFAWVLVDSLMSGARSHQARIRVLNELLLGDPLSPQIGHLFFRGQPLDVTQLEAWWQVRVEAEIWRTNLSAQALHQSRLDVERLASWWRFSESGFPDWLPADGLLDLEGRERAFFETEIEQRLLAAKLKLPEINPVFANTLISLGRFYEGLLENRGERDTAAAWGQFLRDWRFALEVTRAVDARQTSFPENRLPLSR